MSIPFKTDTIRDSATVEYLCYADEMLFGEWNDLLPIAQQEFENNGPVPCEGSGWAGPYCAHCRFGEVLE